LLLLHYHLLPECTLNNRCLFKLFCVERVRGSREGETSCTLAAIFIKFFIHVVAVAVAAVVVVVAAVLRR